MAKQSEPPAKASWVRDGVWVDEQGKPLPQTPTSSPLPIVCIPDSKLPDLKLQVHESQTIPYIQALAAYESFLLHSGLVEGSQSSGGERKRCLQAALNRAILNTNTAAAATVSLSDIALGTTVQTRIGYAVRATSLHIHFRLFSDVTSPVSTTSPFAINEYGLIPAARIIIFVDKQCISSTLPTPCTALNPPLDVDALTYSMGYSVAGVQSSVMLTAPRNYINLERYHVLYDELHSNFTKPVMTVFPTINLLQHYGGKEFHFHHKFPGRGLNMQYFGAGSSQQLSNKVYIMMFSNAPGTAASGCIPTLTFQSSLYFTDETE